MNNHALKAQIDIENYFSLNFKGRSIPRSPSEFVNDMLPQIYTVALILVFVYLIWGGYRWLISAGDPKAVQAAKAHITWAVAGMIIIFISYWMFQALSFILLQTF
jgi:hypothetical protein